MLKKAWHERSARRLKARKVRRLVRYVEPWSVLKVSLVLYLCVWVVFLAVGVTLWTVAANVGLIGKVETFITELAALKYFKFHGDQIFRIAVAAGLLLVMAFTGLTVLLAVLFNLIGDITGGVRITVVEEETARLRPRRPRKPRRMVMMPARQPFVPPADSERAHPGNPNEAT